MCLEVLYLILSFHKVFEVSELFLGQRQIYAMFHEVPSLLSTHHLKLCRNSKHAVLELTHKIMLLCIRPCQPQTEK